MALECWQVLWMSHELSRVLGYPTFSLFIRPPFGFESSLRLWLPWCPILWWPIYWFSICGIGAGCYMCYVRVLPSRLSRSPFAIFPLAHAIVCFILSIEVAFNSNCNFDNFHKVCDSGRLFPPYIHDTLRVSNTNLEG